MSRKAVALVAVGILIAAGAALWLGVRRGAEPEAPVAGVPAARPARRPQAPRDPAAVPAMLRDSSWRTRLAAANSLRTMGQLSVPRRAALLAEAIDREAAAPTSGPPFAGSYLPLSSVLRLQYLGLLEELGAPAADAVGSAAAPVSPAGREWRTLAVAATGDPKGAPVIRELLASSDPAVRMTAARYLGYLRDRDAIPALRRALTDPFTATAVEDAPGRRHAPFYPVRQQAARALRVLGVVVERRGDSYTVK